jgi:hypothetical protein
MNALHTFLANKAADAGYYCPCCKSRGLDADDMDLARGWQHSDAMRDRYGAVCCKGCTDDHVTTEDGITVPRDAAVRDAWGGWWSDGDVLDAAMTEAAEDAADRAMYAGWR